eukprot:403350749
MESSGQISYDGTVKQTANSIIFQIGTDPTNPSSISQDQQIDQESQEKLKQLQQKLQEKDQQRQQIKLERVHDKDKDPEEDYNLIQQKFTKTLEGILVQISAWKDLNGDKELMEKHFEQQFAQYKELRDYVAQYAYSVPSFVLQNCQKELDTLNDKITEQKEAAFPKKKFAFARKQQTKTQKKEEDKKDNLAQDAITSRSIVNNSLGNHLLIKNVYNQEIRKTVAEYSGKENVIIESLENCSVYLPFAVKSLYIKNITDCKIFVGAVSGASFVNAAINCEIHLCSHQIRIHNSERTKFFLVAKSNPIIEHCKEMTFGLFRCAYEGLEQDLKDCHLFEIKNFWNQVLDFNWLKQDKSPNWNFIPEEDEINKEIIRLD